MQRRNIIVALAGIATLIAVLLLFMKVRGGTGANLSEDKKAEALAEYRNRSATDSKQPDFSASKTPAKDPRRPTRVEPDQSPGTPVVTESRTVPRPVVAAKVGRPAVSVMSSNGSSELKDQMRRVSRTFDKGDYPAAEEMALEVLKDSPRNIKMLRVLVTTLCSRGEVDQAREWSLKLPSRDRVQMRRRCKKWGGEL